MSTTAIDPVAIAKAEPGAPGSDPSPEQLRMLAAQFESLLMTQMMNAMRQSMFDENDEGSGFAKGPLADALYSELSLALSRAGGLGLSDSIMAPLMRQAGTAGAGAGDALRGALATPLSYTAPDLSGMMPSSTGADSSMDVVGGMPAGAAVAASLLSHGVTSQYGWRQDPIDGHMGFHKGTDIAMPVGREVPAAQAGEVSFAGERNGYGLTVEVNHGNGLTTRYAHLSEIDVAVGDPVTEGQTLARSGATGRVTGPHLHFEILQAGEALDPSAGLMRLSAVGRTAD